VQQPRDAEATNRPAPAGGQSAEASTVHQWGRWEGHFVSAAEIADPTHDVDLRVAFTAPSGAQRTVGAFWDGGRTWRARFSPDEVGAWTYTTRCAAPAAAGLDGRSGAFTCTPYEGGNPLYRHGAVRVAPSGHYLAHADGTPFFYLGDTCWNAPMVADPADWATYLADRVAKKFTAVQYLGTEYRSVERTAEGHTAYTGREHITIDPAFFQRIDFFVDGMNEAGLLAVPILLHAGRDTPRNPGSGLPDDQGILLARYMVARYGGHHVLWDFSAEGNFHEEGAERWRRMGRAVFGTAPHAPVTLHPRGMDWALDEFIDERWMDVLGYQSAHGDSEQSLRWITEGPASKDWPRQPARPFINLEPPYEGHLATHSRQPFDAFAVRRACYWSLLVSPPAGVTYGGHGVWSWSEGTAPPLAHAHTGTPLPWREALVMPGATSMRLLHELMASLPWWQLRPAQDMVVDQPGREDAGRFVVAARTEDGTLAVVYIPGEESIELRLAGLRPPVQATWVDPRDGTRRAAGRAGNEETWRLATPGPGDWVLVLGGR
jgi:hypothetical protein